VQKPRSRISHTWAPLKVSLPERIYPRIVSVEGQAGTVASQALRDVSRGIPASQASVFVDPNLPSSSKKRKKNLDFYCFVTSL
jgi:hypothetical protein